MLAAVTAVNQQISSLARVLNSATVVGGLAVESRAAGPVIAAAALLRLSQPRRDEQHAVDELLGRCHGNPELLTARVIGQAAISGNELAQDVLRNACRTLGWAIAQVVTLVSPDVVVVGGGVSMIGEEWFLRPLRESVGRYVFPPLATAFQIVPAQLGQLVVVHGALALARMKLAHPT